MSYAKKNEFIDKAEGYDVDGNGCISWNGFRTIFVGEIKFLDPSEARTIFKDIDVDRNREIFFHELRKFSLLKYLM